MDVVTLPVDLNGEKRRWRWSEHLYIN